jgi:uncharacterized membrane protein YcgQ (UPF0703/DUF1980 family)
MAHSWRAPIWPAMSVFNEWKDNAMSDTKLDRIEALLRSMILKIDNMDQKLIELIEDDYYEDNPRASKQTSFTDRFIDEDEIYKKGQKIPYNRITVEKDLNNFREFVSYIRMHEDKYSAKEVDYAGFSDKNFSDIRLSDNTRRILGQAYQRTYGSPWPFKFERGFMHKYLGQIAWSWADGSKD